MLDVVINDLKPDVDEHGFIVNPEQWDRDVAIHLAKAECVLNMNEDHWKLVDYIRDYYLKFGIAPPIAKLCKQTGVNLKRVRELFPSGLSRGLCKVSGLPSMQCKWWST